MDEGQRAYTEIEFTRATNLSALFGWLLVTIWQLSAADAFLLALQWAPIFAAVGLPVAFLVCWFIASPILHRVMRRRISWTKAAKGGAFIAAILAAISIGVGRLNGYRISQDPTFNFRTVREVDGILTTLGWQLLVRDTIIFIVIGAAVGLMVRAIIGPGRPGAQE